MNTNTKFLTEEEKNRIRLIGLAKATYLKNLAHLNAARGLYGRAMHQYKVANRITQERPTTKGGLKPTYTDYQIARAETKKVRAHTEACEYDCLIDDLKERLRNSLLGYAYLRNRTFNQMCPGCTKSLDESEIAAHTLGAADKISIRYWRSNPNTRPSDILPGLQGKKTRIEALKRGISDSQGQRAWANRDYEENQRRAKEYQRYIQDIETRAKAHLEETAQHQAKIAATEAEIKALEAEIATQVASISKAA